MSFNNKIKCDWCKFEGRRNELFVINEIFLQKRDWSPSYLFYRSKKRADICKKCYKRLKKEKK